MSDIPTMSQFAKREDCLLAREKWYQERIEALEAELRQQLASSEPVAKIYLTDRLELPVIRWLDLEKQFTFKGGEYLFTHPQSASVDDARDAERYRYLRDCGHGFDLSVREETEEGEIWVTGYPPDELNKAIDQAIATKEGE